MLTFEKDKKVFSYRVAGVAINNNRVLVQKSVIHNFWFLPGGRCEFSEFSRDALIREMKEEIGVNINVVRPLYFVENFFSLSEKKYHEISIVYLIEFPLTSKKVYESDSFYGTEHVLIFKWIDLDSLEDLRLYPQFLRKALKNIKQVPEHIVNYDS